MRPVDLKLTHRQALKVRALFNQERKRRKRAYDKSNFVPAEGQFDANLSIISMMDALIGELDVQITANERKEKRA